MKIGETIKILYVDYVYIVKIEKINEVGIFGDYKTYHKDIKTTNFIPQGLFRWEDIQEIKRVKNDK